MSETRWLKQRVTNMVARAVLAQTDDEPGMQLQQVSLLHQEGKVSIERFQNYGFSSSAPAESECLVVFVGGGRDHGIVVALDDRASRLTGLQPGEVAVYCNSGDSIVLKGDNTIEITTEKLVINAEEEVSITAPSIKIQGDIELEGDLTATGRVSWSSSGGGGPPDG